MTPAPFTTEDFANRMKRATTQAHEVGLAGVLVTPGPDLEYFTGYSPIAITERITMLAITASRRPAMIVPILERPDAERSPGGGAVSLSDWTDGDDPYAATAKLIDPDGRYAISDSAWAMHVLGLQDRLPNSSYVSMSEALPMLRAVKDEDELERLAAAGAAVDASFEEIVRVQFDGRVETDVAADLAGLLRKQVIRGSTSPWSAQAPTAPTRITKPGSGRSRKATWSCSTSAASRTDTDRT